MEYFWILLAFTLAFISLGVSGLLTLFLALLACASGALAVFLGMVFSNKMSALADSMVFDSRQSQERAALNVVHDLDGVSFTWAPISISGSDMIDQPLNDIVDFIFRDYIYSWHYKLTHSKSFPMQLRHTLMLALTSLSQRIQAVDWMPFLTTRLVDDVASHVRLFKKARLALRSRSKDPNCDNKLLVDLESLFFDAEASMEVHICRDLASSIQQEELSYLQDVAEIILFIILPQADFTALPLRTLTREIVVHFVLQPLLDHLSDPDFINQNIIWLHKDFKIKPDVFLASIRNSDCLEELQSTREVVNRDVAILRSKDSEGEKDSTLKQKLNSLLFLRKVIDNRIHRLQRSECDSLYLACNVDWKAMANTNGSKLFMLPLDVILKNNVALSYFIDFMSSLGCQSYLFFYLNVEGWKVSAEQNIQAIEVEALHSQHSGRQMGPEQIKAMELHKTTLMDNMREAAHSIYEEYLSDKAANARLKMDESIVKRLLFKIRTELPDADWFDECQAAVFDKLLHEERFLEAFRKSVGYVKLLAELDLIKDWAAKSDEEDTPSSSFGVNGGGSLGDDLTGSIYDNLSVEWSDDGSLASTNGCYSTRLDSDSQQQPPSGKSSHKRSVSNASLAQDAAAQDGCWSSSLSAQVVSFQIVKKDGVKNYAMYKIEVKFVDEHARQEEQSTVWRRYSDFYAFHEQVSGKFVKLAGLAFPSKKTFGNMERQVLESRRHMLDAYLKELLKPSTLQQHFGLIILLQRFLEPCSYQPDQNHSQSQKMLRAVGSVKNSVRSVTNAVSAVPNNLIHTVDSVMDGISRALQLKQQGVVPVVADGKVGAVLECEAGDNIPLRIMLLFMDEVFDLRERNQWLRRHIVAVLRQLVKAMFGDIVNRRIVDYFSQMTSPDTISSYLISLKQAWWPNGYPAAPRQTRDHATKKRTRVVARAALFSGFCSDDLKRMVGSETSRTGLLILFDMLQHPVLNKRLAIVLFEGILQTLFHEHDFKALFQKLHSRSNRVRNELKNSQRKHQDLRR